MNTRKIALLGTLLVTLPAYAGDDAAKKRDKEITQALQEFQKKPKDAMKRQPKKWAVEPDGTLVEVKDAQSAFTQAEIEKLDFVAKKDEVRSRKLKLQAKGAPVQLEKVKPGKAPFLSNDLVADLVDGTDSDGNSASIRRTLEGMKDLSSAELPVSPWSDDYWGIYKGITAARYADPSFPSSLDWKENFENISERTLRATYDSQNSTKIDDLSPAEKYDLLVGDLDGSLTETQWAQGKSYYDSNGEVESWMGICHGWAPGAFMLERPSKPVTVMAADGKTTIKFYPADIKALGSLLWAEQSPRARFVGGRCNSKTPKTDSNGRVTDQACFDTNPGTWHMAIVNQIGVSKRSFVLDATFDYEVWNQPIYGYSYTYFNPQTGQTAGSIEEARVWKDDFTKDKFAKYRSSEMRSVVGIAMDLTYIVETHPQQLSSDTPDMDAKRVVRYLYDLELDEKGEIKGGEWYSRAHPDFLWVPEREGKAGNSLIEKRAKSSWDGKSALKSDWQQAGQTAARNAYPLAKIVEKLIEVSNQ